MLKYFLLIAVLIAICFAETEKNIDFRTEQCVCSGEGDATTECVPEQGNSEPNCGGPFSTYRRHGQEKEVRSEPNTKVGRNQGRNLIVNGGFEHGTANWRRYSFVRPAGWFLQSGNSFFTENNLPAPPQGDNAMMTASGATVGPFTLGYFLGGVYQTFTWSDYRNCAFVRFDVSFQYFLRNHAGFYDPGNLFSRDIATQVFRVDILDTNFTQLANVYITEVGTPATTGRYLTHTNSFYISTAANANPADFLRLRFGVRALHQLRVGIDDVRVYGTCLNFPGVPSQPQPQQSYNQQPQNNHYQKEVIPEVHREEVEEK